MMLIPLGTDAPVYHFPWSTIGLISVNSFFLVATVGMLPDFETMERYRFLMLEFDQINPFQWLMGNFMHADIFHLLSNMFFLWGFGLVVEGKLGWWKFLLLYLAMGLVQSAFVQLVMFVLSDGTGCALGASGVIFSVMGIAVIWAPKNDMNCLFWIYFYTRIVNISIVTFGGIYIALQIVFFALQGFAMSSEALHLAGLAVGIPAGIYFVKHDLVDCEGWDYFTVYHATYSERKERQSRRRRERQEQDDVEAKERRKGRLEQLDRSLVQALQAQNDTVACGIYEKFSSEFNNCERLPSKVTLSLIAAMQRQEKWESSIPLIVQLLKKFPDEDTIAMRLNLAQILLQKTDQPKQAIQVLRKIPHSHMTQKQAARFNALARHCKRAAAQSFEIEVHDW